jgi:hypothetical protein
LIILLGLFVGRKGRKDVFRLVGPRDHWDRRLVCHANVNVGFAVGFSIIIVFAAHFRILLDLLPTGLAACHGAAHSAGDDTTEGNQDSSGENNIGSPGHVRSKEENVDQEGQEADEEGDDKKNKEDE